MSNVIIDMNTTRRLFIYSACRSMPILKMITPVYWRSLSDDYILRLQDAFIDMGIIQQPLKTSALRINSSDDRRIWLSGSKTHKRRFGYFKFDFEISAILSGCDSETRSTSNNWDTKLEIKIVLHRKDKIDIPLDTKELFDNFAESYMHSDAHTFLAAYFNGCVKYDTNAFTIDYHIAQNGLHESNTMSAYATALDAQLIGFIPKVLLTIIPHLDDALNTSFLKAEAKEFETKNLEETCAASSKKVDEAIEDLLKMISDASKNK